MVQGIHPCNRKKLQMNDIMKHSFQVHTLRFSNLFCNMSLWQRGLMHFLMFFASLFFGRSCFERRKRVTEEEEQADPMLNPDAPWNYSRSPIHQCNRFVLKFNKGCMLRYCHPPPKTKKLTGTDTYNKSVYSNHMSFESVTAFDQEKF